MSTLQRTPRLQDRIGTREEWQAARAELAALEAEQARRSRRSAA